MSDRPRSNPPIPGSGPTEPDAAQPKTAQLHVGCMMFGRWGINNPRSVERIVHQALDVGFYGFDTAPSYGDGDSETMLGRALASRSDSSAICTKVAAPPQGMSVAEGSATLAASIDASLRRLRRDSIELVLIHRVDDDTPIGLVLDALLSVCPVCE